MTEKTQVGFEAEKSTVEEVKAKLEYGELSERLRQCLDVIAHGTDVSEETRLTDRLQTLREERRDLRQERDNIEKDIEEKTRDIERVEQRLDNLREQDGEYDGVLAMLEEDLHDGMRIVGGSNKIKRAAQLGDCSVDEVIEDLKERNPDVPGDAFRKAKPHEEGNWQDELDAEGSLL